MIKAPLRYPEHAPVLKDNMGRYRTQSLFHEFYGNNEDLKPLWSLRDQDTDCELPSLRAFYMEVSDPTEYQFALQAFGSWNHWKKIRASKAIQPWIEDWNEELEVKLRSVGIQVVLDEAQGGKSAYQAGKAIAEGFWAPRLTTGSPKRGRPSKEEVAKELKIQTRLHEEFKDDAERIGLSLSVGTNEVQ